MEFRPMRITFEMRTPIALTYPWLFFDSLIAHLVQRKLQGDAYRALPSKRVVQALGDRVLPLKKTAGIYHASVSIFDFNEAYTTKIYKRFCEKYIDIQRVKKRKIDRARGHFRDYMISLVYIPARRVTFYANGDIEKIRELLAGLPGLGKKVAIGFGFIKSFSIEETDEDYSIVKDGKAMRPIPLPLLGSTTDVVAMAYKPPYWAKEYVAPCAPPGAWVHLSDNFQNARFKLRQALRELQ